MAKKWYAVKMNGKYCSSGYLKHPEKDFPHCEIEEYDSPQESISNQIKEADVDTDIQYIIDLDLSTVSDPTLKALASLMKKRFQ